MAQHLAHARRHLLVAFHALELRLRVVNAEALGRLDDSFRLRNAANRLSVVANQTVILALRLFQRIQHHLHRCLPAHLPVERFLHGVLVLYALRHPRNAFQRRRRFRVGVGVFAVDVVVLLHSVLLGIVAQNSQFPCAANLHVVVLPALLSRRFQHGRIAQIQRQ